MIRKITGAYDSYQSFIEFNTENTAPMVVAESNGLLFEEGKTTPCAQKLGDTWYCLSPSKRGPKPTHRLEVI
jgi:hypothetical protein